ncbi:hypothetical protein Sjap_009292 [Stephania japonica]|uniref:histone acetyltransferase n=1 Tax=Stephania japonica TaxID=461633 RepID=A0AAP0PBL6_9MAGN
MSQEQHSSPSNAGAQNPVPLPQNLQVQEPDWHRDPGVDRGRGAKLNMQHLHSAVTRVELSLFSSAKTKEEYEDPTTLLGRLKQYILDKISLTNGSGVLNSSSAPSLLPGSSSIPAPAAAFHGMSVPPGSNQVRFQNGHASGFNGGASHGGVQRMERNMMHNYSLCAGNNQNLNQFDFGSNLGNGFGSSVALSIIPEQRALNSDSVDCDSSFLAHDPSLFAEVRGNSANTIYQNGTLASNNVRRLKHQIPNSQQSRNQTMQQNVPFELNQQSRLGLPTIPENSSLNSDFSDWYSSIPAQAPPVVAAVRGPSPNTICQNSSLALNKAQQFGQQVLNSQQSQHQTLQQHVPLEVNQQSRLGLPAIHGHEPQYPNSDWIPSIPVQSPWLVHELYGMPSYTTYQNSRLASNNVQQFEEQIPSFQQCVPYQMNQFQQVDPHQNVGLSSMSEGVNTPMSLDQNYLQLAPQLLPGPSRIGPSPLKSSFAMRTEIDIFGQPQGLQKDEDLGENCIHSLKEVESLITHEKYEESQQLNVPSYSESETKGAEIDNLCATQVQIDCPVSNEHYCETEPVDDPASSKEPIIGTQQENAEMDLEYDHAKSQIVEETVEPCSENTAGEIPEESEEKVLSLIDTFTVEQIEVHIASLRQVNVEKDTKYHSGMKNNKKFFLCKDCYSGKNNCKTIPKGKMVEKVHKALEEKWVECAKCGGWQHHICALLNDMKNKEEEPDYTCPKCYIQEFQHGERVPLPPSAVPGAKELPRTSLSDHIERKLFASLEQERRERADVLGKNLTDVEGAEGLTVRVVCSVDKSCKVNQRFWNVLQRENYPQEFPYKSKVILLFQKIEQVDVILFAMFAQEYGPECDYPNKDTVYISYIDSVKYLRPQIKTVNGEALRTFVFHELLLGYLDYCKKQGLTKCHIWVCPPKKKDDYIFYCHPDYQNIPTTGKLQNWYQFMIEKAIKGNIVVAFSYLYEHFYGPHSEDKVTAANLPYFEGGYFPNITDIVIDSVKKLEERGERKAFTSRKRKKSSSSRPDSYENSAKDILLMKKFGSYINIKKDKKNLLLLHLKFSCALCSKTISSGKRWFCNQCQHYVLCDECYNKEQDLSDCEKPPTKYRKKHIFLQAEVNDLAFDHRNEDGNLCKKFIETREEFLTFCVNHSYQFDTLRRAKHSTAMILYHLHEPKWLLGLYWKQKFSLNATDPDLSSVDAKCRLNSPDTIMKSLGLTQPQKLVTKEWTARDLYFLAQFKLCHRAVQFVKHYLLLMKMTPSIVLNKRIERERKYQCSDHCYYRIRS